MLELLVDLLSIGNNIEIECLGGQKIVGQILKMSDLAIVIKSSMGLKSIADSQIVGIQQIECDSDEAGGMSSSSIDNEENSSRQSDAAPTAYTDGCVVHTQTNQTTCVNNEVIDYENIKPGMIIPLDKLKKIDPSILSGRINSTISKKKMRTLGRDFSVLEPLVKDEHEIENEKYIPATGEVKTIFAGRGFGFIIDGISGKDVYFNVRDIVGDDTHIDSQTAVVYTLVDVIQGPKAVAIHKPGKVSDFIALIERLKNKGENKSAYFVTQQIVREYPNNYAGFTYAKELSRYNSSPSQQRAYSTNYKIAKKYSLEKKYDKAIEFFYKALEDNVKIETTIKDLAMLYASLCKGEDNVRNEEYRTQGIIFMSNWVCKLSRTVSNLQFLENFYYSVRDFENFFTIVNELVREPTIYRDKTKYCMLLNKKAAAFIRLRRPDDASDCIEESLCVCAGNLGALKLKGILEEDVPGAEDIDTLVAASRFDSLTAGLSLFIEQTLDSYEEYAGVPAKYVEVGQFEEATLKGVQSLVDKASGRSRERAKYLLCEGKLTRILDLENVARLRFVMFRYCSDMAKNSISDYSPNDVARFYFNEAFSLEQDYHKTHQQFAYYLLTLCYSNTDLLQKMSQGISVDKALSAVFDSDIPDPLVWDTVLYAFLYNSEITAYIVSKLYSNVGYRQRACAALKSFGVDITTDVTKENFASAWEKAREKRLNDYKKSITSINALSNCTSIEEIERLLSTNLREEKKNWMCALDKKRIANICNEIAGSISAYIKTTGFRNKESNYNNARGQITQVLDDIKICPTKISYEAILPLMRKSMELLNESFDEVVKQSTPNISVRLMSLAGNVVNEDSVVSLQIEVSNHRDSSPIREVSVKIKDSDGVKYIQEDNTSYNPIDGGESQIFKLQVKVSEKVISNRATDLFAICSYKNGNSINEKTELLSLRLYSPSDFKAIDNPYSPIADGGPVPLDSNMFFGRETFISNLVDAIIKSPSKQIIIYGQKRCGKSSVLLHLKKSLQETGKTLCVSFSLGDIINNLTESSFYYKILRSIKDELDYIEFDESSDVPNFVIPGFTDFKDEDPENPLNTFTKYMVLFKLLCKKTPGWENRNLVIMIDEFTYLYTEIKHGHISESIMKQWKAVTQNDRAQFSVVLVGQDVVPSFKKEDYARNAFGVIQDIRLTYLQEEPARRLIETPILDENGHSRYIGKAVDRILEYTSRNPYYIQIFCSRLVDYMNQNMSITVTEADVNDVAKSFVAGEHSLEEDKFDNLIRAGETQDLQEIPEDEILCVLRQIALCTKNINYCNRSDIDVALAPQRVDEILKHLEDREVVEKKNENRYKIQVKLFQEWLLNH